MITCLFYFCALVFFPLIIRALIMTLHELGHALAALLFTKNTIYLYIGSYGDAEKRTGSTMGRLQISFTHQNLWMRKGRCIADLDGIPVYQFFIYFISGPVFPFLVSVLLYLYQPHFESQTAVVLYTAFVVLFMLGALIIMIISFNPNAAAIDKDSGKKLYNEGADIVHVWEHRALFSAYSQAVRLYKNKQYAAASEIFDEVIYHKAFLASAYRYNIKCNMMAGNVKKARRLDDDFTAEFRSEPDFKFISSDYNTRGLICHRSGQAEKALEWYNKALEMEPDNLFALDNKGNYLLFHQRYQEAVVLFDRLIEVEPSVFSVYAKRALAKIKTGQMEEGYRDIQEALNKDPHDVLAVKVMGIYHLLQGDADKALVLFLRVKKVKPAMADIEELILQAYIQSGRSGRDS